MPRILILVERFLLANGGGWVVKCFIVNLVPKSVTLRGLERGNDRQHRYLCGSSDCC